MAGFYSKKPPFSASHYLASSAHQTKSQVDHYASQSKSLTVLEVGGVEWCGEAITYRIARKAYVEQWHSWCEKGAEKKHGSCKV